MTDLAELLGANYVLVRLKSATDFERVRRDGRSHAHPLVVLVAWRRRPDEAAEQAGAAPGPLLTRVGFAAGKSVGTAVKLNRAKRLLRAALQACEAEIEQGWDLLLIARRPLAQVKLAQAQAALSQVLRRARVLRQS